MPDYQALARQAALQQGYDPDKFVRQIRQESGFNPSASSGAGAKGIAQIVPKYHPDAPSSKDPVGQLKWAASYMAGLLHKYGSYEQALSVYNSGKPDAYKDPNFAKGQTYNYVKNIMGGAAVDKRRTALGSTPFAAAPTQAPQGPRVDLLQYVQDQGQALAQGKSPLSVLSYFNDASGQPKGQTIGDVHGVKVQVDHNQPLAPSAGGIVTQAEQYLGTPYKWGGANPKTGFDCSGFVQFLYSQRGVKLPRTTYQQVNVGQKVSDPSQLAAGDIVFFSDRGDVHHEGLYIGNGQFIHAPHTGDKIKISSLSEPYYQKQFLMGRRVA